MMEKNKKKEKIADADETIASQPKASESKNGQRGERSSHRMAENNKVSYITMGISPEQNPDGAESMPATPPCP